MILSSLVLGGSGLAACSSDPDPAKPVVDSGPTADSDIPLPDGGDTDAGSDGGPVVMDQGVQVLGRVDTTLVTDTKTMIKARLSWPGAQIRAKFKGTEVKASFRETGGAGVTTFSQYIILIDGKVTKTLKLKDGPTIDEVLATGLEDAEHIVSVYRKTETTFGTTSFEGFTFSGGGSALPIERPSRRIEFIGDSITAGYGVDALGPYDKDFPGDAPNGLPPGPATAGCWKDDARIVTPADEATAAQLKVDLENASNSYGAIMGATLNAEVSLVGWSGKGLVRNLQPTDTETFPGLYDRAFAGSASPKWDFSKWTPDLVVVNLGTNDFFAGDPGATFGTAYETLLKRIRANHANAWIYAVIGPMVFGDGRTGSLNYIKEGAVKRLNTAGDAKIKAIEVFHAPLDLSKVGCGFHPYKDTNAAIADKIAGEAKLDIGWR
ncbi:MAG: SGNH/GDSL hydrolase family protein [Polyangiaceae bacterium]|nr:SGNH/GDSL hydrolase family protein [Polyangiaceae bacterium]